MMSGTHCGEALRAVGTLGACARCGRVFRALDGAEEVCGPRGVRMRWRGGESSAGGGYRDALAGSAPTLTVERLWIARWTFPAIFGTVWSLGATAWGAVALSSSFGLAGGAGDLRAPGPVGAVVLVIGLAALYVVAALYVNRTSIVVGPQLVRRVEGPLRWRRPVELARRGGERVVVASVRANDMRNLAASWPAPSTYEVRLRRDGEVVTLVEQLSDGDADVVRELVELALTATSDGAAE